MVEDQPRWVREKIALKEVRCLTSNKTCTYTLHSTHVLLSLQPKIWFYTTHDLYEHDGWYVNHVLLSSICQTHVASTMYISLSSMLHTYTSACSEYVCVPACVWYYMYISSLKCATHLHTLVHAWTWTFACMCTMISYACKYVCVCICVCVYTIGGR
jgi:hypothetical protein